MQKMMVLYLHSVHTEMKKEVVQNLEKIPPFPAEIGNMEVLQRILADSFQQYYLFEGKLVIKIWKRNLIPIISLIAQ